MEYTILEKVIRDNKLFAYSNELSRTTENDRKVELEKLILDLKKHNSNPTNLEKFNQMLTKIEVTQTKKPFYRLNGFQKEKLIRSFVEEKFPDKNVDVNIKFLMDLLGNKELSSTNIDYDMENFKINSIKNIELVDDKLTLKPKKTIKKPIKKVKSDN